jgi:hypothetical protein
MNKKAFYFSHDSNAKSDPKIIELRLKHGWEGYGLFWALVELLRDQDQFKMRTHYDGIAYALHTNSDVIKSIINDFDLFIIDQEGFFYSESLMDRMSKMQEISDKASNSAKARWEKQKKDANAMRTHSDGNADAMQIKEKKTKEIKVDIDSHNDVLRKLWYNRTWLESLAMLWKKEIKEIQEHLNKFRLECISKEDLKSTEKDAKEHFVNWTKYNPIPEPQGYVYKRPDLSSLERNPF